MSDHYFGKFRGTVVSNVDPLGLGRIQITVTDVAEAAPGSWAMPCFPSPGIFAVPAVGSAVWIEFEKGDASYPIWTGCFYHSAGDVPSSAQAATLGQPFFSIQTPGGSCLIIRDGALDAADIVLGLRGGAQVSISESLIQIENGKGATIKLAGPAVDINHGALKVV